MSDPRRAARLRIAYLRFVGFFLLACFAPAATLLAWHLLFPYAIESGGWPLRISLWLALVLIVLWTIARRAQRTDESYWFALERRYGRFWTCPACSSHNLLSEARCARCGEFDALQTWCCPGCRTENPGGVDRCLGCSGVLRAEAG